MWIILFFLQLQVTTPPSSAGQPPVLCYHNLTAAGSGSPAQLHINAARFREQMQTLRDSGYRALDPSALLPGNSIPPKSVIITFDDSHAEHFSIAAPILEQTGFRGLFFVMTVTIGKKGYLTAQQIRALHENGHRIGSHTWDHPRVTSEQGILDRKTQLIAPKATLEKITGGEVIFFAYPYGIWNEAMVSEVKEAGYKAAFQLAGKKMSGTPVYSIRRLQVNGRWSGPQLISALEGTFK